MLMLRLVFTGLLLLYPAWAIAASNQFVTAYKVTGDVSDGLSISDMKAIDEGLLFAGHANTSEWSYYQHASVGLVDYKGEVVWHQRFGDISIYEYNRVLSKVTADDKGNVFAVGTAYYGDGQRDLFMVKLTKAGSLVWQHTIDHEKTSWAGPLDIAINTDGSVALLASMGWSWCDGPCGCTSRAIYYYTLDPDTGNVISEKAVGYEGQAWFVSDGFIVALSNQANEEVPSGILALKRYGRDGEQIWAKGYPYYTRAGETTRRYIYNNNLAVGEFDNGYVVYVGVGSVTYDYRGLLFQIDKDGKVNWMNEIAPYEYEEKNGIPGDMLVYSDGSCLLSTYIGYTSIHPILSWFNKDGTLARSLARGDDEWAELDQLVKLQYGVAIGGSPGKADMSHRMMLCIFNSVPTGDICDALGLTLNSHTFTVTPVTAVVGGTKLYPSCTFAAATVSDAEHVIATSLERLETCTIDNLSYIADLVILLLNSP
ncbi:hypothetical protein [Desulfovibrio inopinatus]|uniref:hypothetical protein n=1 Tax=Desulfovibrio inopinatus TaxID=102109 RepID=UPI0004831503|nr:hypothetical protein [Desulfovibrio inopinatus]